MAKPSKRHLDKSGGAFLSQLRIQRALHDGEERLRRVFACREAAGGPALRDLQGLPRRFFIGGARDALVEHHHDVAADAALRLDAQLRAEEDAAVIDIALKHRTLLRHRPRVRQREDLITTRVREHRARPFHEAMNAAHLLKHLRPWPQQQVVGVREQNLRSRGRQRLRCLRLHRRLRADWHEKRCLNHPMLCPKRRRTSA
jgi:hypothetical protein